MDKETIDFLENFKFPTNPIKKENIFDVGIHNMYENPFTEILSFIISSTTTYNNRNEFIKYFILGLTGNENISESFCQELKVETQITTKKGKIIDMVIYKAITPLRTLIKTEIFKCLTFICICGII